MIDTKKSGFCASFSPVKLTYEPSNLLTTTETAELGFLLLCLIPMKHDTYSDNHIFCYVPQGCCWMCYCSCSGFVHVLACDSGVDNLAIYFGSFSRPGDPQLWYFSENPDMNCSKLISFQLISNQGPMSVKSSFSSFLGDDTMMTKVSYFLTLIPTTYVENGLNNEF